jgi:hypothetical protein
VDADPASGGVIDTQPLQYDLTGDEFTAVFDNLDVHPDADPYLQRDQLNRYRLKVKGVGAASPLTQQTLWFLLGKRAVTMTDPPSKPLTLFDSRSTWSVEIRTEVALKTPYDLVVSIYLPTGMDLTYGRVVTTNVLQLLDGTELQLFDPVPQQVIGTEPLQYDPQMEELTAVFQGIDIEPNAHPFQRKSHPYQLRVLPRSGSSTSPSGLEETANPIDAQRFFVEHLSGNLGVPPSFLSREFWSSVQASVGLEEEV